MDVVDQINNLASDIISWIPEFIAALAILIVGYLIALALKTIVESTLYKTGINRRLADSPEGNIVKKLTKNPAAFAGQVIYWIVWIWFITLAILALNVSVLNQVIYSIYGYIPEILAALLILIIAIAVASIISSLIMKLIGDTPTGRVTSAIAPSIILTIALFMILVQLGIATPIVIITYTAIVGSLALGFALAFGLGGKEVASKILDQAYTKGSQNIGQIRKDMEIAKSRGKEEIEKVKRKYKK